MTSIYFSHSDVNQVQTVMDKELGSIDTWMKANELPVNIKKTNYIMFKPRQKKLSSNVNLSFPITSSLSRNRKLNFLVYIFTRIFAGNHT